ncbi:polyketide synthase dehydratase domain-containing protein, partial [Streptomyces sp. AV19]|nr:polyketide synthase dehydratase domain-containing protein [Streptomyces sp. AV19]
PPGPDNRRELTIHSHTPTTAHDKTHAWTHHATATLTPQPTTPQGRDATENGTTDGSWPPSGAVPLELDGFYALMAGMGFSYGPTFQGVRKAWSLGTETFAELSLPDDMPDATTGFALHPALLDATVQTMALTSDEQECLPFAWSGVTLYAADVSSARTPSAQVSSMRVRLSQGPARDGHRTLSLETTDELGRRLLSVDSLALRPVNMDELRGLAHSAIDQADLFEVAWEASPVRPLEPHPHERWAIIGDEQGLAEGTFGPNAVLNGVLNGVSLTLHHSLTTLVESSRTLEHCPDVVVIDCRTGTFDGPTIQEIHHRTEHLLQSLQQWLAAGSLADSRLLVVTRGAVACDKGEDVPDLAGAAAWGLVRSTQSEEPGRVVIVDLDSADEPVSWGLLPSILRTDEPQAAVRGGEVRVPRLVKVDDGSASITGICPPLGEGQETGWRLECTDPGTLTGLRPVPCDTASVPLGAHQVRIGVRAAGVNFRDVLIALGMVEGRQDGLGSEGAGVVLDVGSDVTSWQAGDRVMGVFDAAFGPVAVADKSMLARIPEGWSFAQAASVPIVFATAYYGLVELAGLRAGESVLIHAAAGGVGMAAVQLARHLGAEVFATASPEKWHVLRANGILPEHIASSRALTFETQFAPLTGGRGIDVVLDCLAREFVDASLRLTSCHGGRFLEMGKSDIRDPDEVRRTHPGVSYQAFDLLSATPELVRDILAKVLRLFEEGAFQPLPLTCWNIPDAADAFRHMQQGRHVGKNVLVVPAPFDPEGTVLITGGTGTLA